MSNHGYVKVRVGKEHPQADPSNEDKTDNRLENLEVITRAEHNAHHNEGRERDDSGRFVGKKAAGATLDGREWPANPAVSARQI